MTPLPLLLALAIPTAPAPKGEKGLPKDLVDLIPADSVAVLVLDVPKIRDSEIGKQLAKTIGNAEPPEEPIRFAEFVQDAELILVCQFLIDKSFGDFCVIVRHKAGSELPKKLIDRAGKGGKGTAPEQFGKRTVYSLEGPDASFARIDDRTFMLVLATGDEKQIQETRTAAYAERDKPGPSDTLRKMLTDGRDDRPVRVYGSHPTKVGLSARLVLLPFGIRDQSVDKLGDRLLSYRGGIKVGDTAEIELRITAKDADTAKELIQVYEVGDARDGFVVELRKSAKLVRDGDTVVITAKLTPAMVDRLGERANK
jgi:hypothetical protein